MKRLFCEHCPADGYGCIVCDAFARWEDDGGRVACEGIDHDADTVAAETLRECKALTQSDLRKREDADERTDWVAFWFFAVGATLWIATAIVALAMFGLRRW